MPFRPCTWTPLTMAFPVPETLMPSSAPVVEYAHVKDSGGHTERRPVIETLLRMGDRGWRVRVTLTDRGDMRFPMLVGRTALTPDIKTLEAPMDSTLAKIVNNLFNNLEKARTLFTNQKMNAEKTIQ